MEVGTTQQKEPEQNHTTPNKGMQMNKTELIETLAASTDLKRADVQKVVDGLIETIVRTIQGGDKLSLRRFGTFALAEVERDDETIEEVTFRISPHFIERCRVPAPGAQDIESVEDITPQKSTKEKVPTHQEEPEENEEQNVIAVLRSLFVEGPSVRTWEKLIELQYEHCDGEEWELALSYVQSQLDSDPEWLPYMLKNPYFEGIVPKSMKDVKKLGLETRFVQGVLKRHNSMVEAIRIFKDINSLKATSCPNFLKKIRELNHVSNLAMTGPLIHPRGWCPEMLQTLTEHMEELNRCAKSGRLSQKGISLVYSINANEEEMHKTLREGHDDELSVSMHAEVYLVDTDTKAHMRLFAKGAYSAEISRFGEQDVQNVDVWDPVVMKADGKTFFPDFDIDSSEDEDPLDIAAMKLHKKLCKTFPGKWEPIKAGQTKAPKDTKRFLTDFRDYCITRNRPKPGEEI